MQEQHLEIVNVYKYYLKIYMYKKIHFYTYIL